jgi:hypothetical protein
MLKSTDTKLSERLPVVDEDASCRYGESLLIYEHAVAESREAVVLQLGDLT